MKDKKEKLGVKEHQNKVRWSLLPMEALEPVVRVLEYGAVTKYAMDNWKYVSPKSYYFDAIIRHWVQYRNGEEFDADSGESHLAHLACDVLFLLWDRLQKHDVSFEDYMQALVDYPDYVGEVDSQKFESEVTGVSVSASSTGIGPDNTPVEEW